MKYFVFILMIESRRLQFSSNYYYLQKKLGASVLRIPLSLSRPALVILLIHIELK